MGSTRRGDRQANSALLHIVFNNQGLHEPQGINETIRSRTGVLRYATKHHREIVETPTV